MKIYRISLILLGLFLLVPASWSEDLSTPGAGFIYTMEDLADLSQSFGYDTIIKEATDVLDDSYIDYFIKDTVEISSTDLLTIAPGERLVFRTPPADATESLSPRLSVRGRLLAEGAVEGDIVFTSLAAYIAGDPAAVTPTLPFSTQEYVTTAKVADELGLDKSVLTDDMMVYRGILGVTVATGAAPGQWDNLGFTNPSGKSVLRFVTIEYADIGIECRTMDADRLIIDHCTIHDNYTGIYINRASPEITSSLQISQNRLLYSGERPIRETGTGIFITGISQPLIRENYFDANEGNSITIAGTQVGTLPKLGNIYNSEGGENIGLNTFNISYRYDSQAGGMVPIGQNHIFNETPNTIYAQQNAWSLTDPAVIDANWLYDDDESPDSGQIVFTPYALRIRTGVESENWANYR